MFVRRGVLSASAVVFSERAFNPGIRSGSSVTFHHTDLCDASVGLFWWSAK